MDARVPLSTFASRLLRLPTSLELDSRMRRARPHPRWMMASLCCCCRRRQRRCRRRGASNSRHVDSNRTHGSDEGPFSALCVRRPLQGRPHVLPSVASRPLPAISAWRTTDGALHFDSKALQSLLSTEKEGGCVGCDSASLDGGGRGFAGRVRFFCKCDVFGCPKS